MRGLKKSVLVTMMIVFVFPGTAGAQAVFGTENGIGATHTRDSAGGSSPSTPRKKKPPVKRSGAYVPPEYYSVLTYSPNGWCITQKRAANHGEYLTQRPLADQRIERLFQQGITWDPACANPATRQTNNPTEASIRAAVQQQWNAYRNLPVPAPTVTPAVGVTGMRTYLTIGTPGLTTLANNQRGVQFTLVDPLSPDPIEIYATPTYEVDWGDGNIDSTQSEGGPGSGLYNVYRYLGFYDIAVTAHWEATYTVGALTGELSGLQTNGRIPQLQIDEIQAVEVPRP